MPRIQHEYWVEDNNKGYDRKRYDDEVGGSNQCLVCESNFSSVHGGEGTLVWCPECDVIVMIT